MKTTFLLVLIATFFTNHSMARADAIEAQVRRVPNSDQSVVLSYKRFNRSENSNKPTSTDYIGPLTVTYSATGLSRKSEVEAVLVNKLISVGTCGDGRAPREWQTTFKIKLFQNWQTKLFEGEFAKAVVVYDNGQVHPVTPGLADTFPGIIARAGDYCSTTRATLEVAIVMDGRWIKDANDTNFRFTFF